LRRPGWCHGWRPGRLATFFGYPRPLMWVCRSNALLCMKCGESMRAFVADGPNLSGVQQAPHQYTNMQLAHPFFFQKAMQIMPPPRPNSQRPRGADHRRNLNLSLTHGRWLVFLPTLAFSNILLMTPLPPPCSTPLTS